MNIKLKDLPNKGKQKKILEGLPEELKNYDKFFEVEKQIASHLITSHKHKSPSTYVKCEECQQKRKDRIDAIKALGFTSYEQYCEWKKIMMIIKSGKFVM